MVTSLIEVHLGALLELLNLENGFKRIFLVMVHKKFHISSLFKKSLIGLMVLVLNVALSHRVQAASMTQEEIEATLEQLLDDGQPDPGIGVLSALVLPDPYSGVTLLMRAAPYIPPSIFPRISEKLTAVGIPVDQVDKFGYTAQSIVRLVKEKGQAWWTGSFKHTPLDDNIWGGILSFPYGPDFITRALTVVSTYVPLGNAFLQMDGMNNKEQAKGLFRSFLKLHDNSGWRCSRDGVVFRSHDDPEEVAKRNLPLSVRFLDVFSEHVPDGALNVLATGGTFGVNFKRTASSLEAKVMVEAMKKIADNAATKAKERGMPAYKSALLAAVHKDLRISDDEETSQQTIIKGIRRKFGDNTTAEEALLDSYIKRMQPEVLMGMKNTFLLEFQTEIDQLMSGFFQDYPEVIDAEKKAMLSRHQTTCAAVTLYALGKVDPKVMAILDLSNDDDLFTFIDSKLQKKVPGADSRASIARVRALLPVDFEFEAAAE